MNVNRCFRPFLFSFPMLSITWSDSEAFRIHVTKAVGQLAQTNSTQFLFPCFFINAGIKYKMLNCSLTFHFFTKSSDRNQSL